MNEVIKNQIATAIAASIEAGLPVIANVSNAQYSVEDILENIVDALPSNTDFWDHTGNGVEGSTVDGNFCIEIK